MGEDAERTLQELSTRPPGWLAAGGGEPGDGEDVVMSSRIRLARNLHAAVFPHRADEASGREVRSRVAEALQRTEAFPVRTEFALEDLTWNDRRLLMERHLIGVGLAESDHPAGIAFSHDERFIATMNEGDHLRFSCTEPGLALGPAWEKLDGVDDRLGGTLPFAFSGDFGYLTTSPTAAGTGMKASLLVHLPALVLTDEAEDVLRRITRFGLEIRGVFGEGSAVFGNLFRISNQLTLGRSEEDIIKALEGGSRKLVAYEREARRTLQREAPVQVADKVHRALAILRNARVLPLREAMNLLSAVRFGVNMQVLSDVEIKKLEVLTILVQASHLERRGGRVLDPGERDVLRADLVRESLA